MASVVAKGINEAVQVNIPVLVQLSKHASSLKLGSRQVIACQSGGYQSPFKGRGMEFDESRLYNPGDDIRNIDWRVTARMGKAYTKLYHEERERPVFIWVDYRKSMFFATRGCFKSVLAARMASLLAWSATHYGDRVGGIVFSENAHHELKPQRGKQGALRLINQLVNHPVWRPNKTNDKDIREGSKLIARLQRVARPGSLIFLVSDFRNFDETALSQISRLSRHNEIVMVYMYDQLEKSLPITGRYRVSNGVDEITIDAYDKVRTEDYRRRFIDRLEQLKQLSRRNRMKLVSCSTQDDPLTVLQTGL